MKIIITERQFENLSDKQKYYDSIIKIYGQVLNETMPKKYNWWKGIKINSIVKLNKNFLLDGVLEVPEDWGYEKWKELQYDKYFPKNDAWEIPDADGTDFVSLGDIISTYEGDELREDFNNAMTLITGDINFYISFSSIFLKFI